MVYENIECDESAIDDSVTEVIPVLSAIDYSETEVIPVQSAVYDSGTKVTTVQATDRSGNKCNISFTEMVNIGLGSSGHVFRATMVETNKTIAIKKILQEECFENEELEILRKLEHCNVIKLQHFFDSSGEENSGVYTNLVLDCYPINLHELAEHYKEQGKPIASFNIKLFVYQLLRALAYIHSCGICHRDVKPQNLLIDTRSLALKVADFGSARVMVTGERNAAYICSRYYRAPELLLGAENYSCGIDVWSAGCVMSELLLGTPLFSGDTGVEQLMDIIRVLGTPTVEQAVAMNENYAAFKFPNFKSRPWKRVFSIQTSEDAIDLVVKMLEYNPKSRIDPLNALSHDYFNDLRVEGASPQPLSIQELPLGNQELPPLFDFTEEELAEKPHLRTKLIPTHFNILPYIDNGIP